MKPFDPRNWYWIVGGDATKAYSSMASDYVLVDNAAFLAWKADGTVPTSIDSEVSLGGVLAPYSLRPTPAAILDAYLDTQATQLTIATVAKVVFNHENRIRAIEGQNAISAAQFKNALKALL